ncbi:GNAT family N-acetyltransferase [Ruegeria discodermiae]|uniref:GNAT family N-acetyltransferase n=1 Tax=Ruegeria discodermiae TaxID=3064389 RepID=UPI0035326A07
MTKTVEDSLTSTDRRQAGIAEARELNCGLLQDGTLAGLCNLRNIPGENGATDIGYWLSASFEGRGIATCAVRACVDGGLTPKRLLKMFGALEAPQQSRIFYEDQARLLQRQSQD